MAKRRSKKKDSNMNMILLAAAGIGGYFLYKSMTGAPSVVIFTNSTPSVVNYKASALTGAGIAYQISTDGTQILVSPADQASATGVVNGVGTG